MSFKNSWNEPAKALSYAKLDFKGTYYLAFRDLPAIIEKHIPGRKAVDFGCGAGRSTRVLKQLGFDVIGIDIATNMLEQARQIDPAGTYELVKDGQYAHLGKGEFDLVQAIFTFDNIPTLDKKVTILKGLSELLKPTGKMLCLVSNAGIYTKEWVSFTTKDFPENAQAQSGDIVRGIVTDLDDKTPVEDILWTAADYNKTFELAGLSIETSYHPIGTLEDPITWKAELEMAPWDIYVLVKA